MPVVTNIVLSAGEIPYFKRSSLARWLRRGLKEVHGDILDLQRQKQRLPEDTLSSSVMSDVVL